MKKNDISRPDPIFLSLAMQLAKSAVNREITGEDIAYASDAFPLLFGTEDAKEGISAFLEKRKPVFKGN